MKYLIYIALAAIFVSKAYAGDSTAAKREVPVRYFDSKGRPLAPQDILDIHEMDCDPFGWRWSTYEWRLMKHGILSAPKYDKDPEHGSNHGYCVA